MASSSVPLSLLAKGIGQLSKNGHERLDVYLEPEDYYNLESKYEQYQLQALRREAARTNASEIATNGQNNIPLHKTFLTRKGALLLFSEELAKKALEEERSRHEAKIQKDVDLKSPRNVATQDKSETDPIRTCNDLSWAILSYGNKPDYRKKGNELYLRFIHEPKGNVPERRIRPGFSPKRYISTWSRHWDEGMLQKLRSGGMISDKTLYRQNPLLPHLYKYATYNLSARPPPYRVTKNMLLAPGNVPSYEFYRVKGHSESVASLGSASRAPPPSQLEPSPSEVAPLGGIQAVKYHESGEIQEVTYSELKPQEKQEILAELLVAAHEHQQHIRDTLELVLSSKRVREGSDREGSSSAASELMADMQRAILSLVESPVRQQMKERQRLVQEQEEKMKERKRQQELKEEKRQKRRQERKAQKAAEQALAKKAAVEAQARRAAEKAAKLKEQSPPERKKKETPPEPDEKLIDPKEEERQMKEERRRKRKEDRENRRKMREKKVLEEKAAMEMEAEELASKQKEAQRPPSRDEQRHDEEHQRRRHGRHRHLPEDSTLAQDERKHKSDRKHRRKSEKESIRSQQDVEVAPKIPPEAYQAEGHHGNDIYAIVPQDGFTEIKHANRKGSKHQRVHAGMGPGAPTQVPTNTPAVDMRVLARPPPNQGVEYDEVILLEPLKGRRRRSHASSIEEGHGVVSLEKREILKEVSKFSPPAPRSAASSHSSAAKQVVFAPELPNDDTASVKQRGSFYGGRMPITSNLVKQTLSDKVSILSGGNDSRSMEDVRNYPSSKSQPDHSSVARKSYKSSEDQVSEKVPSLVHSSIVPSIGIEPATPLAVIQKSVSPFQQSVLSSHHTVPGTQYLSPSASIPGSHKSFGGKLGSERNDQASDKEQSFGGSDAGRSSKKSPSKKSDSDKDDSDSNGDDTSQSSLASDQKSLKRSVASKSSQTTSSKSKKSKHASLASDDTFSTSSKSWMKKESVGEPTYSGMKGIKGPGSQSSSSNLKSTSTKKSRSSRGSVPSVMKRGNRGVAASLTLPDGEVVSVGGSLVRSSGDTIVESETKKSEEMTDTISKGTLEEQESEDVSLPKPALKSVVDSTIGDKSSSVKQERRVSFQEVESSSQDDEDQDKMSSDVEPTDYEVTDEEAESEKEENDWPAVKEEAVSQGGASSDSRPISSRSEKLTAHAQKVAAIVVKKHRPGSGLDEDAKQAAELWNQTLDVENEESEVTSEEEEEEEEWEGAKKAPSSSSEASKSQKSESTKESMEDKRRKDRLKKILADKKKEKELRPSISSTPKLAPVAKDPSVPETISSVASTVSSAQEAFVNEIQRKASDLGIEPTDLEFQADVVSKLEKSDITPDDVEVIHDKEAGRHVVRSRRSSITVSSVLTPSSEEVDKSTPRDVMKQSEPPKQKLVVDLNLDKQSASPSRRSSVTSSMSSASHASPLHSALSSTSQRRASIPVDKGEVKLDYDVTTYEGKLGNPKPEEPTIQSGRPHIEPEKIKNVEPKTKPEVDAKQNLGSKLGGPGSVGSSQVSKNKSIGKQPAAKTKAPNAPTKGPLRKGQVANLKAEEAKSEVSSVTASEALSEDEKLQRDLTKITETQKNVSKKDSKKKKPSKGKPKAADSVNSEKVTRKPTPEKAAIKTPETPFRAGRPKETKPTYEDFGNSPDDTGKQESIASISKSRKSDKSAKNAKKKREPVVTQVEVDTPKVEPPSKKQPVSARPTPSPAKKSDVGDDESEDEEYLPAESPEDNYDFVRKEDTPEPTPEPEVIPSPPKSSPKPEDTKSQTSEVTQMTETTERSSQLAAQAAEDEAEREAKLAAKQEREQKRAAAAERRRQEVERKRKEKEEQSKREKEELERQEQMKEELDAERKKREEAVRMRKEEAERQKQREKEEEELRQKRLLLEQERDRKQKEEYRRKMEEVQRKKREEEEKKQELAKIAAAEEAERKRLEDEMLAEMEESARLAYKEQKQKEEEERKKKEEEKRKREEEEAKIAMEQARLEAIIRAKQAAALEEKLRFVREFFTEANGLDQTQNVHRSFTFSYFELMQMLGLDVVID